MVVKNGKHKLVGFVDLGETHDAMACLTDTGGLIINSHFLHIKLSTSFQCPLILTGMYFI